MENIEYGPEFEKQCPVNPDLKLTCNRADACEGSSCYFFRKKYYEEANNAEKHL